MDTLYGWPQILRDRAPEKELLDRHAYPEGHPAHLFFQTVVPRVYGSTKDVDVWRNRFAQCVKMIEETEFAPGEGLQALRYLTTFGLGYQQQNDRDLLSRLYKTIVEKVHRKALPQYSEPLPRIRKRKKLRVGYISESLNFSNGAQWAIGWMENHGAEIETYAFSLAIEQDFTTQMYRRAVDHFFLLGKGLWADVAVIKAQDLDVLIYTDIGMGAANPYFAGLRLAPVQCTAWGHPVTSGFPTIDYYLSSDLMEPRDGQDHYCETLIRLPGSGVCFTRRQIQPSNLTKEELGLDDGPIFLSCQNVMKYLPQYDHVFARICQVIDAPITFIAGFNEVLTEATRTRMEKAGVRMKWLPPLSVPDFLRVQQLATVSIDSIGWSGANTTLDSLSLGVPVVTLPGQTMRARHSLAFLQLCGGEGLVTKDIDDFVALVGDEDRRNTAMKNVDSEELYDDLRPVRALDEWMLSLFGGS